jgi:hypothetical protein
MTAEPLAVEKLPLNMQKFHLLEKSYQHVDSLQQQVKEEKSVLQAALFSAVVPGAGQFYAGSVWKGILFAGLEVAAWTTYFVYDGKGDSQDSEMQVEQRYWSWLYYNGTQRADISSDPRFPDYALLELDANDPYNGYLLETYNADVVASLRFLEEALGHSHKLPETKTQQYYEMIYKYATQFGNAWNDADFYATYYGNTNQLTPNMFIYRDMRNQMNEFYDTAKVAANVVLINHILSALDAAWTTRSFNREIRMNLRVGSRQHNGERVQMYGVNIAW